MRDNYGSVLKPESIIKKEARGIDNTDLGEIKEITFDCIITQKDTVNKDKFIIPKDLLERFHEDNILFQITEKETETYRRKTN
jgi:hypothetical protein